MKKKDKYYISNDISEAETMHSDFYTNEDLFKSSNKKIFSSSWKLVGHKTNFKCSTTPFTFLPEILPYELLLINQNDLYSCISNVCTHRGHILCNEEKNRKVLRCKYHARTFDFSGKIKSAPGFNNVKNFPLDTDNLALLDLIDWNGFLFVCLGDAIDIRSILNDMKSRIKQFPFDKLNFSSELSSVYTVDAHWAIYCENYLEGFHVPFVHKGLSSEINISSYKTEILDNGVLQYADNADEGDVYGYYYWVFPNIMFNFYNWGLSINIIEPITKDRTLVRFLSYPFIENNKTKKAIKDLVTVELEDQEVVSCVNRGIKSPFYRRGRYSHEHEKGVHYFHRLLTRYI